MRIKSGSATVLARRLVLLLHGAGGSGVRGVLQFLRRFGRCLVLAFLTENLSSPWTLAVVPVLTAITFLVANLVARLLERADA